MKKPIMVRVAWDFRSLADVVNAGDTVDGRNPAPPGMKRTI